MKKQEQSTGSNLFLVRLWQSVSDDVQPEWTGRVVHITSGKASNFPDLSTLAPLLLAMLIERQKQGELVGNATGEQHTKKGDNNEK